MLIATVLGGSFVISYVVGVSFDRKYVGELAQLRIKCDFLASQQGGGRQSRDVTKPKRLDGQTAEILRLTQDGPVTASHVREGVGQSREHVSRVLKRLASVGYLERVDGRPYKYIITDKGRKILNA